MCILSLLPRFLFYHKLDCSFHTALPLALSPHFTVFLNDFGCFRVQMRGPSWEGNSGNLKGVGLFWTFVWNWGQVGWAHVEDGLRPASEAPSQRELKALKRPHSL